VEEKKFKAVKVKHRKTGEETIVCNVCAKDHNIVGDVVLITNELPTVECAECGATVHKVTPKPRTGGEIMEDVDTSRKVQDSRNLFEKLDGTTKDGKPAILEVKDVALLIDLVGDELAKAEKDYKEWRDRITEYEKTGK
jgi:transcription elongation factor Elf1